MGYGADGMDARARARAAKKRTTTDSTASKSHNGK